MAYTSYKKMSKRKQKEEDARKRVTWGQTKPVTRKIESSKTYNRKKTRRWQDADGGFCFMGMYSHATLKSANVSGSFSVQPRRSPFSVALLRPHSGSLLHEKISRSHGPILEWHDYIVIPLQNVPM